MNVWPIIEEQKAEPRPSWLNIFIPMQKLAQGQTCATCCSVPVLGSCYSEPQAPNQLCGSHFPSSLSPYLCLPRPKPASPHPLQGRQSTHRLHLASVCAQPTVICPANSHTSLLSIPAYPRLICKSMMRNKACTKIMEYWFQDRIKKKKLQMLRGKKTYIHPYTQPFSEPHSRHNPCWLDELVEKGSTNKQAQHGGGQERLPKGNYIWTEARKIK